MRRYLLIVILVVFAGLLLASESSPSATVGYFKLTVETNSWTPISIPFNNADMSVVTIMGNQFGEGDMVADIATGESTFYYGDPFFTWDGALASFTDGHAYWINRLDVNPTTDYFIMGTVDPQPVTISISGNAWTPFSLNQASATAISSLPITGAVDQDMIADIATGQSTIYYGDPYFVWDGELQEILPTHTYWYFTTSPESFDWTYPSGARQNTTTQPQIFKVKK